MIYFSEDPYDIEFEETLSLRRLDVDKHPTAGLMFTVEDFRLFLNGMTTGSPGWQHPRWRSRLKGAWLRAVGGTPVETRADVAQVFARLQTDRAKECKLLFSLPEKAFHRALMMACR